MAHSEISYNSHGSRVAKAIGGALIGLILFVISPFVLFFNEGRAVQTEKSLNEGSAAVKNIPADKIDKAFDGKLVALNGEATTTETLSDPDFKVNAPNAIKLIREVEMYQWQEHKESKEIKRGDGSSYTVTNYTYDQDWVSHHVDSTSFSEEWHQNPKSMKYEGKTVVAKNVTLGAFTLTPDLVEKIDTTGALAVDKKPAELKPLKAVLDKGDIYLGLHPETPAVGDMRVHYKIVSPMVVSVVAQQSGSSFVPFQTSAGDALLLLKEGKLDGAQMFDAAQADNTAMTWVLRFLGWMMMLIGLGLVFRPAAVIGDRLPLLGTLAGAGLALSAFLIASSLSMLTIGLAWLIYRPLLGLVMLALAGGAGYLYVRRVKAKKAGSTGNLAAAAA